MFESVIFFLKIYREILDPFLCSEASEIDSSISESRFPRFRRNAWSAGTNRIEGDVGGATS